MQGSIDIHDLNTKLNQIRGFIAEGHPVKLGLMEKKAELKKAPDLLLNLSKKVYSILETSDIQITAQRVVVPERMDFQLSRKKQ